MTDLKNEEPSHIEQLENAIEQLEIKVAYQEHTIHALNEEIARQQQDVEQLTRTLNEVVKRVKAFQPSDIAKQSEETPPPHY
jgi:SlyX protein